MPLSAAGVPERLQDAWQAPTKLQEGDKALGFPGSDEIAKQSTAKLSPVHGAHCHAQMWDVSDCRGSHSKTHDGTGCDCRFSSMCSFMQINSL